MRFAIDSVSAVTRLPLCLDTTNPDALAAGIAHCDELGLPKPLINSFSMQPDKLEHPSTGGDLGVRHHRPYDG